MRNPRLATKEKQPQILLQDQLKERARRHLVCPESLLEFLFEAGLRSASKSQRPFLEKAAADTGLTISQVVVSQQALLSFYTYDCYF